MTKTVTREDAIRALEQMLKAWGVDPAFVGPLAEQLYELVQNMSPEEFATFTQKALSLHRPGQA